MNSTKLFFILLTILFVQIVTLEPFFGLPVFTNGEIAKRVEEKSLALKRTVVETFFSAEDTRTYKSIIFVGDVMLGRNVEVLMKREDPTYPFVGLELTSLAPEPAIVGNFESSMATPHTMTPAFGMRFSVDETLIPSLKSAGYTHLSQANNHSNDYGSAGFKKASNILEKNGMRVFGRYDSLSEDSITYIDTDNGIIALIGVNATVNIPSRDDLRATLDVASKHSTLQVIYIHWGNEYEPTHSVAQELFAKELVAAGADLIVGHHPHVVQDIDVVDGVVVFYSLGNYIFDQYFSKEVQEGLVLSFLPEQNPSILLIPVSSEGTLSQPHIMQPASYAAFLEDLAKRSHESLRESIIAGHISLSLQVATSTKMAMIDR
jgi:hypothetical protein